MEIKRGVKVKFHEYPTILRASIIRLLTWLNENVLINEELGFNLRSKLADGMYFNQECNQYLIESYCYWIENRGTNRRNSLSFTKIIIESNNITGDSDGDETATPDLRVATPRIDENNI